MLRDLFEYVVGLAKPEITNICGYQFTDKKMHLVQEPQVKKISTNTLRSIVDYIISEPDMVDWGQFIIQIENSRTVHLFTDTLVNTKDRDYIMTAKAMTPEMEFDTFFGAENFNIMLQSRFVNTEDRDILLRVVGNLKDEAVQQLNDDGVSQKVTIKSGIATVSDVKVPNPVVLAPYRTFAEVNQPESRFIFRMREGGYCGLFEADGGAWKLETINNIREYLEEELQQQIADKKVTILA